jgi:sugar phosphate isomerase/epimerase
VLIDRANALHLTYCTNIHAAEGWSAVDANLRRYAPALKRRFAPDGFFGIGLRLSARDARELLTDNRLETFRAWLDAEGLYVAIINGFPFGSFHRSVVKADVYAPDWRDEARVAYTLDLARILSRLLPAGIDGGVSTAPLSYKAWMAVDDDAGWTAVTDNVVRVAVALARIRRDQGAFIHLDIEPEPDCSIETTDETIAFFERRLLPRGIPQVVRELGVTEAEASTVLRDHVRVCFDCCHFAVEHEDPIQALDRLSRAGIRVGRIQLSSALRVNRPADPAAAADTDARLRRFADSTYLHQVVARDGGRLEHFPDLGPALDAKPAGAAEWRVHFHVPLFTSEYEGLGSTQDDVRRVMQAAVAQPITTHLEIETYTWDVLPDALKIDLLESIGREYDWVLGNLKGDA